MMVRLKAVGLVDGLTIRLPVTQEQIGDAIRLSMSAASSRSSGSRA